MEVENNIPIPQGRYSAPPVRPPMVEACTTREATDLLKISRSTLYRLFEQRELVKVKIGSKTLVVGVRELLERKAAQSVN